MNKKFKNKILLLLMISMISVYLARLIIGYNKFNERDIVDLKESLNEVIKIENEYLDFPEALNIDSDLYTTYYSLKCLELLRDKSLNKDIVKSLIKWIKNLDINDIKDDINNNYIYEVYYYTELLVMLDVKLEETEKNELINSINEYQDKNNINIINKNSVLTEENIFQNLFDTYYYLEILDNVHGYVDLSEEISSCIDKISSSELLLEPNLNNLSKFKILLDICKLANYDIDSNRDFFSLLMTKYNDYFEEYLNDLTQIPVLYIIEWIDLNEYLNNNDYIKIYDEVIYKYISNLQDNNGMFALMNGEASNIMTTYVVLEFMKDNNQEINKKDNLINYIVKNKVRDKGFNEIIQATGNLENTYYFNQIYNLIKEYNTIPSLEEYLKYNEVNEYSLYYLLNMGLDISSVDISRIIERIQNTDYKILIENKAYDVVIINLSVSVKN